MTALSVTSEQPRTAAEPATDLQAPRRAAHVALVAGVLASGIGMVLATRLSFFWADDYLNFALARQYGLGLKFLEINVFGELAPGHRLLDWLMANQLGLHWSEAIVIMMVFWLAAVIAFERAASELFESRWVVAVTTVLFASSPVHPSVIQWWANAAHEMPATCGTLVALAASLRWLRTRSTSSLVIAGAGYLGALMFYTKPVLLPLYVIMLAYLIPRPRAANIPLKHRLRRDLPLLATLVGITGVFAVVARLGGYLATPKTAGLSAWFPYLRIDWLQGVTPWLIGQSSVPTGAAVSPIVDALAQVALIVLVALSIARRRAAWRAWAFYLIAWAANVAVIGHGRLGLWGAGIALDPRYNAELAFIIPLTIGLAFSVPGHRPGGWLSRLPRLAEGRGGGRLALLAGGATAAAFAVSLAMSYARMASDFPGGQDRAWVTRAQASIAALRRRGIRPAVVGRLASAPTDPRAYILTSSAGIGFEAIPLAALLQEIGEEDVVEGQSGHNADAIIAPDGSLRVAAVHAVAGGGAATLARHGELSVQAGAGARVHGAAFCAHAGPAPVAIHLHPPTPVPLGLGALQVGLEPANGPGSVLLYVDAGLGYGGGGPYEEISLAPGAGSFGAPLPFPHLAQAIIVLRPGLSACLTSVRIVNYRFVAPRGGLPASRAVAGKA